MKQVIQGILGEVKFNVGLLNNDPWHQCLCIRMGVLDADGVRYLAKPVEFETIPPETNQVIERDPMLHVMLDRDGTNPLQSLMDQMWAAGMRPSEIGSTGHLHSVERHLNDMRVIVASQLGCTFPT
jgi:hypothetical protein